MQNPEAWLRKECSIRQLSISLDQHTATAAASSSASNGDGGSSSRSRPPPPHSYQPLLRIASLSASALLPAFAWLEVRARQCGFAEPVACHPMLLTMLRRPGCWQLLRFLHCLPALLQGADLAGDPFNTTVEVQLSPVHGELGLGLDCAACGCLPQRLAPHKPPIPHLLLPAPLSPAVAVNDRQLRWAGSLTALMQAAPAADRAAAAAAAAAAVMIGDEQGEQAVTTPRAMAALTPQTPLLEAAGATSAPAAEVAAASTLPGAAAAARPQTKALGVFGKVWDFMIDEAAYAEAAEGERARRVGGWVADGWCYSKCPAHSWLVGVGR